MFKGVSELNCYILNVFDNKNIKTIRAIEYNSLYLHNKIAFKNEAK